MLGEGQTMGLDCNAMLLLQHRMEGRPDSDLCLSTASAKGWRREEKGKVFFALLQQQ
jgi:hypothetical protein